MPGVIFDKVALAASEVVVTWRSYNHHYAASGRPGAVSQNYRCAAAMCCKPKGVIVVVLLHRRGPAKRSKGIITAAPPPCVAGKVQEVVVKEAACS